MNPQARPERADPCIPAARGPCAGASSPCGQLVGRVQPEQKNGPRDILVRFG